LNYGLALVLLGALAIFIFDILKTKNARRLKNREAAWPQFEELYISALQSGISPADAFSHAADFGQLVFEKDLAHLVTDLDRGMRFEQALRKFGTSLNLAYSDLFIEIVVLAHETGGQNLIRALQEHADSVRDDEAAKGSVLARTNAILNVAKLGLLAPWVLIAVLSGNQANWVAYTTLEGQLLMVGGFAVSLLAFRLVAMAGELPRLPRAFELK
jgi:tight adherence protein B